MKLRTRAAALLLTLALAVQLPLGAFAEEAAPAGQDAGQIVVVDENGRRQVLTAEDLANGNVPDNIIVEENQAASGESSPAGLSVQPEGGEASGAAQSAAAQEAAPSGESTAPQADAQSAPVEEVQAPAGDGEAPRIDVDLPLVNTQDTNRIDETVPVAGESSPERIDVNLPVSELQQEPQAAVYWNPGEGYKVDPAFLKPQDTPASQPESASTPESTSAPESTSTPESGSGSDSSSVSAPQAGSGSASAPQAASSSDSASLPAAPSEGAGAPESAPENASGNADTPAAPSESAPVSAPAESASESAPASAEGGESLPAGSGPVPAEPAEGTAAPQSLPLGENSSSESAVPGEGTAGAAAPESADAAGGLLQQAGRALDGLSPVQTAHAAGTAQPEQAQGFFERAGAWLGGFFGGIGDFFGGLVARAMEPDRVPEGNDANNGRSPLAPVKTWEAAQQRAREAADELGVPLTDVTVYMLNPLEITGGGHVELSGDMLLLKAWEGRGYDSDVLFYVQDGSLSLRNVVLTPRSLESLDEAAAPLVWAYGGAVTLENGVSAYGSFMLDFLPREEAKAWSGAALSAEKYSMPVLELGQSFAPSDMGYTVQVREQSRDSETALELVRAPYLDAAALEGVSGSFAVTGDTMSQWELEVRAGDGEAPAAPSVPSAPAANGAATLEEPAMEGGGQGPASASLYAVRASAEKIYWNPGPALTINGQTYPAGSDTGYSGLDASAPLKTLNVAMAKAAETSITTIVCMQPVDFSAPDADEYVLYNSAAKRFEVHGSALAGDVRLVIENWSVREQPIFQVSGSELLSLKNIELRSVSKGTALSSGTAVVEVSGKGQVALQDKVAVRQGFVRMQFDNDTETNPSRTPPLPLLVNGRDNLVNVFASGVNAASHWRGTEMARASDELVSQFTPTAEQTAGQQAGEYLAQCLLLEKGNSVTIPEGGTSQYAWKLAPGIGVQQPGSLYLMTDVRYDGIYVDPVRGSDLNDGASCEYPVATLGRALEVYGQTMESLIAARTQKKAEGMSREERDEYYPLPSVIYACSPIVVEDKQTWDWTQWQGAYTDEDGNKMEFSLQPHTEPGVATETNEALHERNSIAVRLDGNADLTLGNGVRLSVRPKTDMDVKLVALTGSGASLTLTGDARLWGDSSLVQWSSAESEGSSVGTGISGEGATGGTVLLAEDWTGSLSNLKTALHLGDGQEAVMSGGTIENCNRYNYNIAGAPVYLSGNAETSFTMNSTTAKIINNERSYSGYVLQAGAVLSRGGNVVIQKGLIENNSAPMAGAIGVVSDVDGLSVTLGEEDQADDSLMMIRNNTATNFGSSQMGMAGAVYVNSNSSMTVTMYSGTLQENQTQLTQFWNSRGISVASSGGMMIYEAGDVRLLGGVIKQNCFSDSGNTGRSDWEYSAGVGIVTVENTVTIQDMLFEENTAETKYSVYGLAFAMYTTSRSDAVVMERCQFRGNSPADNSSGGAPSVVVGPFTTVRDIAITGSKGIPGSNSITNVLSMQGEKLKLAENITITGNEVSSDLLSVTSSRSGSIVRDITLTGNTCGRAIYAYAYEGDLLLTESNPGASVIENNTFQTGMMHLYSNEYNNKGVYLNFQTLGTNTYSGGASSYVIHTSGGNVYLPGSRVLLPQAEAGEAVPLLTIAEGTSSTVYLDPVNFAPQDAQGRAMPSLIRSTTKASVKLLQTGNAEHPLHLVLDDTFTNGSYLLQPAECEAISAKIDGVWHTIADYTQLLDAAAGWQSYVTVENVPLRTAPGAVKEGTLTMLALIGEGVYLDGQNGSDENTGTDPGSAVRTWDKAAELLKQYSKTPPNEASRETGFQPTIYIVGTVDLADGQTIALPQGEVDMSLYQTYEKSQQREPEYAMAKRYSRFLSGPMFRLKSGAASFESVKIYSNYNEMANGFSGGESPILLGEQNTTLTLGDGTRISGNASGYSSASSSLLRTAGALVLHQSYAPDEVDEVNDERHGNLVDLEAGDIGLTAKGASLTLTGYATMRTKSQSLVAIGAAGTAFTMQDHSYLAADAVRVSSEGGSVIYPVNSSPAYATTFTMEDDSRAEAPIFLTSGSPSSGTSGISNMDFHMVMRDRAQVSWKKPENGRSYALQMNVSSTSSNARYAGFLLELYDDARFTGNIWIDAYNGSKTDSPARIVLGEQGGNDSPVWDGTLTANTQLYGTLTEKTGWATEVELSAGSQWTGAKRSWLLNGKSTSLFMHDRAQIILGNELSTMSSSAALGLTGQLVMEDDAQIQAGNNSSVLKDSYGTLEIHLKDNAAIDIGRTLLSSRYADATNLRTNSYIQQSRSLTMEGNAAICRTVPQAEAPAKHDDTPVVSVETAVLKDNALIAPFYYKDVKDDAAYGDGLSLETESLTMDGTVTVGSAIAAGVQHFWEGSTADQLLFYMEYIHEPITLTSPAAGENTYRLQLSDKYIGDVVVQPGGDLKDASAYLDNFEKAAAQGEAENVDLKAQAPNIVLDRLWDVYLSVNGNDKNDGSSPLKAVRTFQRAKELLETVDGYGEGSDILIPDYVTVQKGDMLWSFDEGGTLTNEVSGETWKPRVTRVKGNAYEGALIRVFYFGSPATVRFENITLDGGGEGITYATDLPKVSGNTVASGAALLSVSSEPSRPLEVVLGENTVFENADVELDGPLGTYVSDYAHPTGVYLRGSGATLTIDGAVFRDLNLSTDASLYNGSVISAQAGSTLNFENGSITGNTLLLKSGGYMGASILSVGGNATINLKGGDISGNVVRSEAKSGSSRAPSGYIVNAGYEGTVVMTGGSITGNRIEETTVPVKDKNGSYHGGWYTRGIVGVTSASSGGFIMRGGTISGNEAYLASAVMIESGDATFSGGVIKENHHPKNAVGDENWKSYSSPVWLDASGSANLILEGGGCDIQDPIFLEGKNTIILTKSIKQTSRLYEVYPETVELGAVIVQPDGDNLLTAAPYLSNFNVHALGRMLDYGRTSRQVDTSTVPMSESACLLLYRPVFVNGETGQDPSSINIQTGEVKNAAGQVDTALGYDPEKPVKTFDAAKLLGQATDPAKENPDWQTHLKHKDYYVIFATGEVYNELYRGEVTLPSDGSVAGPNQDASDITYTLEAPAHMARYTNFEIHLGDGHHKGGPEDERGGQWYNYGSVFSLKKPGSVTLENITVYGRREVDPESKSGEALVKVGSGVELTLGDGAELSRNNANGTRPGPDGIPVKLDSSGGALRILEGGVVHMEGGEIHETLASYGSAIYVSGGQTPGRLTLKNELAVSGEVYLGGDQGSDAFIEADASFTPGENSALSLVLQSDYNGKKVVEYTDGAAVTQAVLNQYSLQESVKALYEILGQGSNIVLGLKNVYYIDPQAAAGGDGRTPDSAFDSLDALYAALDGGGTSASGVLAYVVSPIVVNEGDELELTNAYHTDNGVRTYYSHYKHGGSEYTLNAQVYFKRYSQPADSAGAVPEGYSKPANKDALFDIQGTARLNGVYMDGHRLPVADEARGLTAPAVEAEAPLVRVQPTGLLACKADPLNVTVEGGQTLECSVEPTLFSNNINVKKKDKVLEGTASAANPSGNLEGSSAGLEILAEGQGMTERRGKAELSQTQFLNLALGQADGVTIVGGTDIYQNGELTVGDKTFFEGSVYLEGNGFAGSDSEAMESQYTSRWLGINLWGQPVQNAFTLLVRDPYDGRCMVRYPKNADPSVSISSDDIGKYMLHETVSRYYSLIESVLSADEDPAHQGEDGIHMLYLRAPQAVYLDPENGSDPTNGGAGGNTGYKPAEPVKTLDAAIAQMKAASSKVLYIMNPVEITGYTEINNAYYKSDTTDEILFPNTRYLTIRRFASVEGEEDFDLPSYDGVLFTVKAGGELVVNGDVEIFGSGIDLAGEHIPNTQRAEAVQAHAPLLDVQEGGVVRLGEGASLTYNDSLETAEQPFLRGGAANIRAGGTLYLEGGSITGTKETPAGEALPGQAAHTVYSEGSLVVEQNPAGLDSAVETDVPVAGSHTSETYSYRTENGVVLGNGAYLTMGMLLNGDEALADLAYNIGIADPSAGRTVVSYDGYSGVDAEHSRYRLNASVPDTLFLVEAEDAPNILELQDWQLLDVQVPEELFLGVHEYKTGAGSTVYTRVSRMDVSGAEYGAPEYTITNNGAYEARVTATGFVQQEWQGMDEQKPGIQLVQNKSDLAGESPLLYLALGASGEAAEAGNQFAGLAETPLGSSMEMELGVLKPGEHGSFAFAGEANKAFMDAWMDPAFPNGPLDSAESRMAHLRHRDALGNTSLNNAAARFKLRYRVELAQPRR